MSDLFLYRCINFSDATILNALYCSLYNFVQIIRGKEKFYLHRGGHIISQIWDNLKNKSNKLKRAFFQIQNFVVEIAQDYWDSLCAPILIRL